MIQRGDQVFKFKIRIPIIARYLVVGTGALHESYVHKRYIWLKKIGRPRGSRTALSWVKGHVMYPLARRAELGNLTRHLLRDGFDLRRLGEEICV